MGILAGAAAVLLLYYGRVFLITITIAGRIAFLLEPMVGLFMKLRMPRGLASFLVCSIWLLALYFAGLGVYNEGRLISEDLPAYGARINEIVDDAAGRVERVEQGIYRTMIPKRFQAGGEQPQAPPPEETLARKSLPDGRAGLDSLRPSRP